MARTITQIAKEHPALTFDNNGYEYIDGSKLSQEDIAAIAELEDILKDKISGFVKFFNFKPNHRGELEVRVNYCWDSSFIGVGYFALIGDNDIVQTPN